MKQIEFILITFLIVFILGMYSSNSLCHAQDHIWTEKSSMPAVRWGHSACELNGKVYILGGRNVFTFPTIPLNTVWMYDPLLDTCITKANMDIVRTGFSTCEYNGKIYAIGGAQQYFGTTPPSTKSIDAYDPEQDSWTHITDMPVSRYDHTASLVGSKIYIIGGYDDPFTQPFSQVDIYDLATDTWTTGAPMPTPRVQLCAVVLNGKIYTIGGQRGVSTNESGEKTVEVYDPAADTWTSVADMLTKRKMMSACTLDGNIYVFGGPQGYCTSGLSGNEVYKPEADSWIKIGDMPKGLALQTSTVVDNKIYITGGLNGDCTTYSILSTINEYNPYYDLSLLVENVIVNRKYAKPGIDNVWITTKMLDTTGITLLAKIKTQDQIPVDSLLLYDDGNHDDGNAGDSLYANFWHVSYAEERNYYVDMQVTRVDTDIIINQLKNMALFTTIGPINVDDCIFTSSDTIFNPGDNLRIYLNLKNNSTTATATNIEAKLFSLDTLVTVFTKSSRSFGDIVAGEYSKSNSVYSIEISKECPVNTSISFLAEITSDGYKFWSDTFYILVQEPTSLEDIREPLTRIYPNPTYDMLNIEIRDAGSQEIEIEILDITGTLIYQKQLTSSGAHFTEKIDLSGYSKGIFLLQVKQANTVYVGKVVVR